MVGLMKKIGRLTGGLRAVVLIFGITLLGLTGLLWIFREDDPPQYFLMSGDGGLNQSSFKNSYAIGIVGEPELKPLEVGVIERRSFQGWSANGRSLLFVRSIQSSKPLQLIRLTLPDYQMQILDDNFFDISVPIPLVHSTPNGRWLIYTRQEAGLHNFSIIRRRFDGSASLNLTVGKVASYPLTGAINIVYTPDDESVYFHGKLANGNIHVFRVRLDGGPVEDLTPDPNKEFIVESILTGTDWLLVLEKQGDEWRRWKMSLDGQDWQLLADNNFARMRILGWLPKHEMLLVFDYDNWMLIGWRVRDGTVVWQVPESDYLGATSDGQWVLLENAHREFIRMRPDGTDALHLTKRGTRGGVWGFAPDSDWFWFTSWDREEGPFEIRRVNMAGHLEIVASFDAMPQLVEWSADGEWVLFNLNADENIDATPYRVRTDGTGLAQLVSPSRRYPYLVGFAPQLNLRWQREWSAVGGLLLIGLSLTMAYFRRRPAYEKNRAIDGQFNWDTPHVAGRGIAYGAAW